MRTLRVFLANVVAVLLAAACAAAIAMAFPQAALAAGALVLQDQAALRAAPRDSAPLLTPLWRGEALELRGAKGDWLQVWDHHRERGGFVRAAQVLALPEGAGALYELSAQLRLVRQQPGAEALGLGLAATLIERAPAAWLASTQGADVLEAMVLMQDRLAERVNSATGSAQTAAAAHAAVAARYGHGLQTVAQSDGGQRLCPNLEPARLLRGLPDAQDAQKLRAALQLTRADCISADLPALALPALHAQRAQWLEGIPLQDLPAVLRNRLLLRRVSVQSSLAFAQRNADAQSPAAAAMAAWTQLIPAELTDDDSAALRDAAIRLAPLRWALQKPSRSQTAGDFELQLRAGEPGQSCLHVARKGQPLLQRCSHGWVLLASARASADGRYLSLQVQPLDGWTELWRLGADGTVQVLPPSSQGLGLGIAEFAGWAGGQLLVAREALVDGKALNRRFEVYGDELLQAPLRWSDEAQRLAAFQRSADVAWRANSPLLR